MAAPDNPNLEQIGGLRPEGAPPDPNVRAGYQPSDELKHHHAHTASKLAGWLVWILAGSVVVNYSCLILFVMLRRDDGVKALADVFHVWIPLLAGLAGSAVTFYFTRER